MLNLNELEAMWLRYKIKSYIPHVVIFFSTVVIISIVLSIDFNSENEKNITKQSLNSNKEKQNEFINETIAKEKDINQKTYVINSNDNKKMLISPNLDFIKSMHKNSPLYYDSQDTKKNYLPENKNAYKKKSTKEEPIKKQEPAQEPAIEVEEVETEIVKENIIDIQRQTTEEDIQLVIERFKKSNNPTLSLFIAKKYYELGNYNQSYNYALMTNELNNNIEDSWIIFAKSLLKLNKKQKAIDILQEYVSHSHSSRASMLLDNIKSGKIK